MTARRDPAGTHRTPSGAVIWIPERPDPHTHRRSALLAAFAVAAALAGLIVWWPGRGSAMQDTSTSVAVLASDTSFVAARRPSYDTITDDSDRRAALRGEIMRCKEASAGCDVNEVLRMGSELVQLRKRVADRQLVHAAMSK
jgi:hypothetical protein